jgi:hypothetical protein
MAAYDWEKSWNADRAQSSNKNQEHSMADAQIWSKELPAFSFPRLIVCPHQPGNLKISEKACLKRYQVALNRNIGNGNGENIFNFFLNQGLLKCQRCTIAKTMASNSYPAMSG